MFEAKKNEDRKLITLYSQKYMSVDNQAKI